jgi:hypothetical protein
MMMMMMMMMIIYGLDDRAIVRSPAEAKGFFL